MAVCKHLIYGIDLCSFLHQEGHGDRVHILLVNADENEMHFFKQAFAKQYKMDYYQSRKCAFLPWGAGQFQTKMHGN